MKTYCVETSLEHDGTLMLTGLPFRAGDRIKIVISAPDRGTDEEYPLRGTVIRYIDPTEPVAVDDWDALRCDPCSPPMLESSPTLM